MNYLHHTKKESGLLTNSNKGQSNSAKRGIAVVFTRWQQQFVIACFGRGFDPKALFPWGQRPPSNTMCHWTPQVYLLNGI